MHVVLLGRMPAAGEDSLRDLLAKEHRISVIREPANAIDHLDLFDTADVVVGGPITPEIAEHLGALRLFHVFRGGADGLGIELLPGRVAIANTFHHEVGVAEFAVMSCLLLPREISKHDAALRRGDWAGSVMWGEPPEYASLSESNVLIVGAGHIGSAIIERLRGFGSRIVAVSRDSDRRIDGAEAVGYDHLDVALSDADFVILSVRLAENTQRLIGANELKRMKKTAYLINVARGSVVDQHALYDALRRGEIAGAAIDVWYNYPTNRDELRLPSDAPLYELGNVIMSPNRSSWTRRMLTGRIGDVAQNVKRLAEGAPLINQIRAGE